MANDVVKSYENAAEITQFWLDQVVPRYFDPTKVNTYRAGTFGYINDILSTVAEDSMHAMMIAKREVLPNTAKYTKSLYLHAAARLMDAPMATPATANVLLMFQQSEILKYGTDQGNLHTFVLDDTFVANVDGIPFMMDYPLVILSQKRENGKYAHTTHYDFYVMNTLADAVEKYLPNKMLHYRGTDYLIVEAKMRQLSRSHSVKLVTANTIISTVTMDFMYDGMLANFEVFYQEDENSPEVQLKKMMEDSAIPKVPFCWYKIVDEYIIRLTFPANVYFAPKLNSTIRIEIYTSLGEGGNFDQYDSDIVSENTSTKYPYNTQVPVFGTVDGPSSGGKDTIEQEEFREMVMRAYATNMTFITNDDLQRYFDTLMVGTKDRFKFTKQRDDSFVRLHGAFLRMRDITDNVIPTNTLDMILDPLESAADFDAYALSVKRLILKPGALFTYRHDTTKNKYILRRVHDRNIGNDLSDYEAGKRWTCACGWAYDGEEDFAEIQRRPSKTFTCPKCGKSKEFFKQDWFLFTNPYLINISTDTFMAGYYLNSVFDHPETRYTDVNDFSIIQFLAKHFKVERNAIAGENFYRFSIALSPSVDVDLETVYDLVDEKLVAPHNGFVSEVKYKDDAVYATITYTDDPLIKGEELPTPEETIQVSSIIHKTDKWFRICPKCGHRMEVEEWDAMNKEDSEEWIPGLDGDSGYFVTHEAKCEHCVDDPMDPPARLEAYELKYIDYDYTPGYEMRFNLGDKVSKNDVIATRRPKDLGRIRVIMDLNKMLGSSQRRYIPMTLEQAEVEGTYYFVYACYIEIDDIIDSEQHVQAQHGYVMKDGSPGDLHQVSLPITDIPMSIHTFWQYREEDDLDYDTRNPAHNYSDLNYVQGHTFTNTYELQENVYIDLIRPMDHAKGYLDVFERANEWNGGDIPEDPNDPENPNPPDPPPIGPDPPLEPPTPHPKDEYEDEPCTDPRRNYLRTVRHERMITLPINEFNLSAYLTVLKEPDESIKPPEDHPFDEWSSVTDVPLDIDYRYVRDVKHKRIYTRDKDGLKLNKLALRKKELPLDQQDALGKEAAATNYPVLAKIQKTSAAPAVINAVMDGYSQEEAIAVAAYSAPIHSSGNSTAGGKVLGVDVSDGSLVTDGGSNQTTNVPPGYVYDGVVVDYGHNFMFKLRNCPMVGAKWVQSREKEMLLIEKIQEHYSKVDNMMLRLENAFAIDMKFYNTYGKSKFYKIGYKNELSVLDSVNVVPRFGAGIIFPASAEVFRANFRNFVADYIEGADTDVGNGVDIYLMNLISDAKVKFEEIGFLEYYGINNYGYYAQRIVCMSDDEILKVTAPDSFVPELLNVTREESNGTMVPIVDLTISDLDATKGNYDK